MREDSARTDADVDTMRRRSIISRKAARLTTPQATDRPHSAHCPARKRGDAYNLGKN